MKKYVWRTILFLLPVACFCNYGAQGQTIIPNSGFETWTNYGAYENPQYWDTPNSTTATIPFVGKPVVEKSTDAHGGSYSAKLITQNIIPFGNIPGFITLGHLTIDLAGGTYVLTGGVPINDLPTHLMGYYKFLPKGDDSCSVGILLTKFNAGVVDTVGYGYFSTHDSVGDWTHFSAWINYILTEQPDTMNVLAISSAEETTLDEGTTLYLDDLYLDYTLGIPGQQAASGINVYQDRETSRLLIFYDFDQVKPVSVKLYGMTGQVTASLPPTEVRKDRQVLGYGGLHPGVYILEVLYGGERYCRKFLLNL